MSVFINMLKKKSMLKLHVLLFVFCALFNFNSLNRFHFSLNVVRAMESEEDLKNTGNIYYDDVEHNEDSELSDGGHDVRNFFGFDLEFPFEYGLIRSNFNWHKMLQYSKVLGALNLERGSLERELRSSGHIFNKSGSEACRLRLKLVNLFINIIEIARCLCGDADGTCNKFVKDILKRCEEANNSFWHDFIESGKRLINSKEVECNWSDCCCEYNKIRRILQNKKANELSSEEIKNIGVVIKKMCNLVNTATKMRECFNTILGNIGKYLIEDNLNLYKNLYAELSEYLYAYLDCFCQAPETVVTNICVIFKLDRSHEFIDTPWFYCYRYFVKCSQSIKEEFENLENRDSNKCEIF